MRHESSPSEARQYVSKYIYMTLYRTYYLAHINHLQTATCMESLSNKENKYRLFGLNIMVMFGITSKLVISMLTLCSQLHSRGKWFQRRAIDRR